MVEIVCVPVPSGPMWPDPRPCCCGGGLPVSVLA